MDKNGYSTELLTIRAQKWLGSSESKIAKQENEENV